MSDERTGDDEQFKLERGALRSKKAVRLWQKGKYYWNKWADKNKFAEIDFSFVDFSQYKENPKPYFISFNSYHFPNGKISFYRSDFSKCHVDFNHTHYGNADVSFREAILEDCFIRFDGASFGSGNISFTDIDFRKAIISLEGVNFGQGNFRLNRCNLYYKSIIFEKCKFGDGEFSFEYINLEKSHLYFGHTEFGEGSLTFKENNLTGSHIKLEFTKIKGNFIFEGNGTEEAAEEVSFKGTSFSHAVFLSGSFSCIIDLTATQAKNHVDLSKLHCTLPRIEIYPFIWWATDPKDAARLRRLKELAEDNKHHEAALRFHADEMRAKRWHEFGFWASLLDMAFSGFSNYGQSVARPAIWLFLTWVGLFLLYVAPDNGQWWIHSIAEKGIKAIVVILTSSLPFVSHAWKIRHEHLGELVGVPIPDWANLLTTVQGIISFIFLFLIGLGLRNRFRI